MGRSQEKCGSWISSWRNSPGPVIGSGGYLGAIGRALLEMNFASVGAYLVAVSLLLVGILLTTDYAVPKFVARIVRPPLTYMRSGGYAAPSVSSKRSSVSETV